MPFLLVFDFDAALASQYRSAGTVSSSYRVTGELSGGIAAVASAIGLGDSLWHAGLDQTSPVNQTKTQTGRWRRVT